MAVNSTQQIVVTGRLSLAHQTSRPLIWGGWWWLSGGSLERQRLHWWLPGSEWRAGSTSHRETSPPAQIDHRRELLAIIPSSQAHTTTHLNEKQLLSRLQLLPAQRAGEAGQVVDLVHGSAHHVLRAQTRLASSTLCSIQPAGGRGTIEYVAACC